MTLEWLRVHSTYAELLEGGPKATAHAHLLSVAVRAARLAHPQNGPLKVFEPKKAEGSRMPRVRCIALLNGLEPIDNAGPPGFLKVLWFQDSVDGLPGLPAGVIDSIDSQGPCRPGPSISSLRDE